MKRILGLLLVIALGLTALPLAEASIRVQSVSSGLFAFDGPTQASYAGNSFGAVYNQQADRRYIGVNSRTGGPSFGIALQRPTYTQNHRFHDQNYNYRTREHGDWQLQQAKFNWPNQQTSVRAGQLHGQYSLQGNVGGYTGGPHYGAHNAFARAHNIPRQTHPHTYSNFGFSSTRSAYTQTGRAYY